MLTAKNTTCRFCDILIDQNLSMERCNTIIFETEHFVVLPALGSLVVGYLMIISRAHYSSMAYCNPVEATKLLNLISDLDRVMKNQGFDNIIIFEHGSAEGCTNKSAFCVEHAHLHILPCAFNDENDIIEKAQFKRFESKKDIFEFKGTPYLLYINHRDEVFVSKDVILPSQYMRKWVALEIKKPTEWDWRRYPFDENIEKTICMLQGECL